MESKPDFFIAGNSKSGTTALYKFLKQHPGICMSEPKEPNFFAKDFCHDVPIGAFTCKAEEEYLSFFDDPTDEKRWGEASACYLYSKVAARKIHAFNPEAKIIIMLREPVSFLHSYHMQLLKNVRSEGETVKDFERALALEEQRKHDRAVPDACLIPEMLYYSERVKYAEQIARFLEFFEREQLKVIIYEDFKADNAGVFRNVLEFLEVDPAFEPPFKRYNKGEKLQSKTLQTLMHDLTHGEGLFAAVQPLLKRVVPSPLRRLLIDKAYRELVFQPKPEVDPALREALKRRFRNEVEKLSRLLDRDLTARWGYDQVDASTTSMDDSPTYSKTT